MVYTISVIIPTFNRNKDLEITLNALIPLLTEVNEVLVVDQSIDIKTKELITQLNNPKIKYLYSSIPSITIARNLGVKNVSSERLISMIKHPSCLEG